MREEHLAVVFVTAAAVALFASGCAKLRRCDLDRDWHASTQLDYFEFHQALVSNEGSSNWNPRADFDKNGTVTTIDYALLLERCPLPEELQ